MLRIDNMTLKLKYVSAIWNFAKVDYHRISQGTFTAEYEDWLRYIYMSFDTCIVKKDK